MPITTKLVGGLGNQLFQIANCIAFSIRHNIAFEIPQVLDPAYKKYAVYFHHFPPLARSFDDFGTYREPSFTYTEIPKREQICFEGYFQSWKYFEDYKKDIFNLIWHGIIKTNYKDSFNRLLLLNNQYHYQVAIHVRRGDYASEYNTTHPPVSMEYLRKAIYFFYEKGHRSFTVFSDDIHWCKNNLVKDCFIVAPDAKFLFAEPNETNTENENVLFDFYSIASHSHQIISNSTFSLWAAMINTNPDKIVVCPDESNWFGKDAPYDAKDIIPTNFHRIKY